MFTTRLAMTVRNSAGAATRGRITSPYKSTINSNIPNPPTPITTSKFSTSIPKLSTKKSTQGSSKSPEEPPPMEFSFKGLDMSRNTRIVVLVILSIFGTIESIFWVKTIWRWFSGPKDDESESSH
ncbi:hypothetical protein F4804DRAFT_324572 [Jackrogersella minutella]|nr:hypothetical protein F4804DRAFT_324572 [Jackrogersella minutella]